MGVGDASRNDAAELFGELLLELEAHIRRAAERVRQFVQDGPSELREGLQLSSFYDDLAVSWFPYSDGFLIAAFHETHGLGDTHISEVRRSAAPGRKDPRE